jgi:hypothetical protein
MKNLLLISLTLLLTSNLFSQDSTYKNAIRFFIYPFPTPAYFVTLNYERQVDSKNSVELTTKFLWQKFNDAYYPYDDRYFSIVPSFRHYLTSKKMRIYWLSIFSPILFAKWEDYDNTHFGHDNDIGEEIDVGIGAVFGRRIDWGKNKRMLLDIGLGGAYYFIRQDNPMFLPKIIFIVGRKF